MIPPRSSLLFIGGWLLHPIIGRRGRGAGSVPGRLPLRSKRLLFGPVLVERGGQTGQGAAMMPEGGQQVAVGRLLRPRVGLGLVPRPVHRPVAGLQLLLELERRLGPPVDETGVYPD